MKSAQMQIGALYLPEIRVFCSRSRDHHDVQSSLNHVLVQSVALPLKSCNVMAHHAVPHFFADGNPDPRIGLLLRPHHIHNQKPVCIGFPGFIHLLEIPVLFDRIKTLHAFSPRFRTRPAFPRSVKV